MGQHHTLSDEREKLLAEVGFVWDAHNALWQERYQDMVAFHAIHGHCVVPYNYKDPSLSGKQGPQDVVAGCCSKVISTTDLLPCDPKKCSLDEASAPSVEETVQRHSFHYDPRKIRNALFSWV